jgi:2-polyprenyl-3-methyl-5-hydroxy-6-metoxy-1,4-benzoquinol methylase
VSNETPASIPSGQPQGGNELYAGYASWKGWTKPVAPTAGEIEYYDGEMKGLAIAGSDVFEIGFGSGIFLAWARDRSARLAGAELIAELIENARAAGVEILPPDFETVAAAHAARFDTIAAFDVFEHFSIPEILVRLDASAVMLKPGGHLIMRFPNAQSPFGLAPQNGDPTHKAALSRSVFEQLLQGRPFEIVRYAAAYRVRGPFGLTRLVRGFRYVLRDLLARVLNFTYAQEIVWDPVVVLVLRKRPG